MPERNTMSDTTKTTQPTEIIDKVNLNMEYEKVFRKAPDVPLFQIQEAAKQCKRFTLVHNDAFTPFAMRMQFDRIYVMLHGYSSLVALANETAQVTIVHIERVQKRESAGSTDFLIWCKDLIHTFDEPPLTAVYLSCEY